MEDVEDGRWRVFGGYQQTLSLRVRDLDKKRLSWLVTIQDPGFYEHKGVDFSTPGAGLTTISQSIVKRLYFRNFKPGIRKLKQSLIAAFVVNKYLSKQVQLEIFINSVYMGMHDGEAVYGLAKSSRHYFEKDISELSDDEYIALLAMLIGPDRYHVLNASYMNKRRVNRIKSVLSGDYQPKGLMDVYYDKM
jgi:membrane carboxypeptidase/penicillin-binding protein